MTITVLEELRAYIDPLTPEEHEALERSILAEGCRDALVLWGDVLVDGHNRYGICQKHGIPFQTVQNPRFTCMEDVHLWMIEQHLGRRSVSDFQRGVLALRKKEILASRREALQAALAAAQAEAAAAAGETPSGSAPEISPEARQELETLETREALARAARLSSTTVSHIEKIQKQAAPELVEAVKAGTISINAAAAVATLPVDEQVAAVAGGKKELQQAARQVREARARPKAPEANVSPDDAPAAAHSASEGGDGPRPGESPEETIARLLQTVAALRAQLAQTRGETAPW
ncbi:MAG: plasmid replication/partition related protein [Aquabacterium sp.]|uniref:plasmid replication/partition related protein n=1 Tax=Aquabacterium sp. TaxID=1872578 RepID=UPI003BCA7858